MISKEDETRIREEEMYRQQVQAEFELKRKEGKAKESIGLGKIVRVPKLFIRFMDFVIHCTHTCHRKLHEMAGASFGSSEQS